MKFFLTLTLFILVNTVHANELTKLIKPEAIKELNWDKSFTEKEALKEVGKESLREKNTLYYIWKGYKYPLTLTFKDNKISKLTYIYFTQKISAEEIIPKLKGFTKEDLKGSDGEVYYKMVSKDKKIKIKLRLNDHSVYAVERWY